MNDTPRGADSGVETAVCLVGCRQANPTHEEGRMAARRNSRQTGARAARAASKVLRSSKSSKAAKTAAASALSQTPKK